jgi:enamine deaminase RidA (YjgF/YER057c/UK114 family)
MVRKHILGETAMAELTILQPAGWPVPRGYSNGIVGTGRLVTIGGQIGWDAHGRFPTGFVAQAAQALRNVLTVLHEAGGRPEHIARLTWYVLDIEEYRQSLPGLGSAYRDTLGRWYPAMTLVQVSALVEREARLEIEATAIVEPLVNPVG